MPAPHRPKRAVVHALLILGTAFLIAAITVPLYMIPRAKHIPLGTSGSTQTDTLPGTLFDAVAMANNKPIAQHASEPECSAESSDPLPFHCFIETNVPIESDQWVIATDPANDHQLTLQAGNSLLRMDRSEPKNLISANIDRVTIERASAAPIAGDKAANVALYPPSKDGTQHYVGPTARSGFQYQFPFDTLPQSYPFFDINSFTTKDIHFTKKVQQDGLDVYQFQHVMGPLDLYEPTKEFLSANGALSADDRDYLIGSHLTLPNSQWGLPGDGETTMNRYYVVERTINVEPVSGVITYGRENIRMYFAQNDEEAKELNTPENIAKEQTHPQRTVFAYDGKWNQQTQDAQMSSAIKAKSDLKFAGQTLPWVLGIIGAVLFLLGFVLWWIRFGLRHHH